METKMTMEYNPANHATLEDLFENAIIGLHIVGQDGIVKRANRADRAPVGLADNPLEYIGHHIGEFHAEDPVVEEILENLLNNRKIINYRADLKTINGSRAPVIIYSNSKMDGEEFQNTRCFTKVGVEELKEFANDQNLKQISANDIIAGLDEFDARNRFEELKDFFDNGLVSVHVIDASGIIQWANIAELTAMGYEHFPGEYIGQPLRNFYADKDRCDAMIGRLRTHEPLVEFEAELVRRDGSIFPVHITSNSRVEHGKFVNSRCFTYPASDVLKEHPIRFTWPRNEKMFE